MKSPLLCLLPISCWFLAWLIPAQRWGRQISLKRWFSFNELLALYWRRQNSSDIKIVWVCSSDWETKTDTIFWWGNLLEEATWNSEMEMGGWLLTWIYMRISWLVILPLKCTASPEINITFHVYRTHCVLYIDSAPKKWTYTLKISLYNSVLLCNL
jgi:hypothetical protein